MIIKSLVVKNAVKKYMGIKVMKVRWSAEYKALLLADLTFEALKLPRVEIIKLEDDFNAFVKKTLELSHYEGVKIDERYKSHGPDIKLVSESKDVLVEVCNDIAAYTHEQPFIVGIELDAFE